MNFKMIKYLYRLSIIIAILLAAGCVKDTYNMTKLSKQQHLSPTMAISAIKGVVSLSDIVKSNDTVVIDNSNFVKLVFKKDSFPNLALSDFFDYSNLLGFSQTYTIGDLSIDPFQVVMG